MRSLEIATRHEKRIYLKIASSKSGARRTRLLGIINDVVSSYRRFQSNKMNLASYQRNIRLTPQHEADLIHAYEVKTQELENEKFHIFKRLGDNYKCPYCSVGNGKQEIDHFLPKRHFPEFSILTKNMIPSCNGCNGNKLSKFGTGGAKLFFNPYYDRLPTLKFLHCNLSRSASGIITVSYYLRNPGGISVSDYEMLENHFNILKLLELYADDARSVVRELFKSLEHSKSINPSLHSIDVINGRYMQARHDYGENYYKAVLFNELLSSGRTWIP
jgi:5-methylcytosine-specific restriction endonuclease McrA